MPELPEVETIRTELDASLPGRRLDRIEVFHDDLLLGGVAPGTFRRALRGRRIDAVRRRGKSLLFELDPGAAETTCFRVQLRMTGRFWLGTGTPDSSIFRHPGARFDLDDGRTLHYDDVRRLGGFDLLTVETRALLESRLGPEPLDPEFTAARLAAIVATLGAPIKNVLLDQRRVAGLGNIYASEALHGARIAPVRPARTLDDAEVRRLHRAIRTVLRDALASSGTTLRDYRSTDGQGGNYQTRLRVYGRGGRRCRRCGGTIERLVQAGRSTFYCPACQS